jgi:type VI protein secretion system component Hcp
MNNYNFNYSKQIQDFLLLNFGLVIEKLEITCYSVVLYDSLEEYLEKGSKTYVSVNKNKKIKFDSCIKKVKVYYPEDNNYDIFEIKNSINNSSSNIILCSNTDISSSSFTLIEFLDKTSPGIKEIYNLLYSYYMTDLIYREENFVSDGKRYFYVMLDDESISALNFSYNYPKKAFLEDFELSYKCTIHSNMFGYQYIREWHQTFKPETLKENLDELQ